MYASIKLLAGEREATISMCPLNTVILCVLQTAMSAPVRNHAKFYVPDGGYQYLLQQNGLSEPQTDNPQ
jgi:hypothetical protein